MTVTLANKPVVIPESVLRKAGVRRGDRLEFKVSGGDIGIKVVRKIARADDEYTPEQRRVIDLRLRKALGEVKQGRTAGPFNTADEMIASLKQQLGKSDAKRIKSRVR
jgi:bifunctional DNA-binding transcriptional regulator/antitoxin component of YhaV-PrlF toxin-antitoxin module